MQNLDTCPRRVNTVTPKVNLSSARPVFWEAPDETEAEFDIPPIPRWKRIADICVIALFLPLLAPIFLLLALIIRTVSDGPVLFRQERIGRAGKKFMCLKFRTMFVGDHSAVHEEHLTQLMDSNAPMVKMDAAGDPRIIPFGKTLRSTGMDELPQLINVLRGEMSLVGPRPCLPYEFEKYLPWQKERVCALPGITGLWQVSGKNKTTFEEMVRLDIIHLKNENLARHLAILAKTGPVLIGQAWESRKHRRSPLRQVQLKAMVLPANRAGSQK
jgi:lipopolysaccharide/colanic/teichoic acid biosynthesis glycosyltransferase